MMVRVTFIAKYRDNEDLGLQLHVLGSVKFVDINK